MTESLTTDLSRIAGSFVIARNTAFTYKGKRFDVKQIGRELNVRYVSEGSVQRSGNAYDFFLRGMASFYRADREPSARRCACSIGRSRSILNLLLPMVWPPGVTFSARIWAG